LELQRYFKEILWKNDFVSLPGIGSFVKTNQPATISPDGSKFFPPKQAVTFDVSRTFKDEAAELFFQEKFSISSVEATEKMNRFIENVKAKLDSGDKFLFDGLGSISKNNLGNIVFFQEEEANLASETYGLAPLDLISSKEVVLQPADNESFDKKNVVDLRRRKRVQLLLGIAAAVVIIGIFSTFLFFVQPEMFLLSKEKAGVSKKNDMAETIEKPLFSDSTINQSIISDTSAVLPADQVVKSVEVKTDKRQALFYQEKSPQDLKTYYIIAGSFTTLEKAQKYCDLLLSKGYKPEIVEGNGKFRIAIVKYSDRTVALRELERVRQQKPNESFWLLGV